MAAANVTVTLINGSTVPYNGANYTVTDAGMLRVDTNDGRRIHFSPVAWLTVETEKPTGSGFVEPTKLR